MSSEGVVRKVKFSQINIADPFFDSLKSAYQEFSTWFHKKANEEAFIAVNDDNFLVAFLYLKIENGTVNDIEPPLFTNSCLKVGTFKINAHGTKLGERFVKKIVDTALCNNLRHAYVTVFPQHSGLIDILNRYGFKKYGKKNGPNGVEDVYLKDMTTLTGDLLSDYPILDTRKRNKWLLSIRPDFHSKMFPDSILKTEASSIIDDVSFSNSIHKAYLGFMKDFKNMKPDDCIVIYRCMDPYSGDPAWFKSVATSLCVIEEVRPKSSFNCEEDLVLYSKKYSVFEEDHLKKLYNMNKYYELYVLKMSYNVAFPKRPNLKSLVENAGLPKPKDAYYGLLQLTDAQFGKILQLGQIYEGIAIY